jgi:hypothetical protein
MLSNAPCAKNRFGINQTTAPIVEQKWMKDSAMYEKFVKELREAEKCAKENGTNPYRFVPYYGKAADTIEELTAERDKYKSHSNFISQLPDCNNCGKKAKGNCEFMPAYGDWVRINCAFWIPQPPKEEA